MTLNIFKIYFELKIYQITRGFRGGSNCGEPPANAGFNADSIPGLGRSPGGGHSIRLQYSCLEKPHGQRSLAGYSSQVAESDTAEATELHACKFQRYTKSLETLPV